MAKRNERIRESAATIGLTVLTFLVSLATFVPAQSPGPEILAALKFRFIGPIGNRVSAVAGVPGQPNVYYAGAASGGIWKTTDGGVHWIPVFDDQPAQSIGSLAVAPSDPNIVWAGTGEAHIRSNVSIGNGIYRSADGGKTWKHAGLEKTGRIGRIIVDPANPDIVLAAAMGHCYGPQPERGVFRTTDGGTTWSRVLFVDENTGAAEIAIDPHDSKTVFASTWQLIIMTWGKESGGPGSGLFVSRDSGATWNRIQGHGLPASPLGKISVAIAPSDSRRVYALIESGDGVPWKGAATSSGTLWRSDDGGGNWRLVNSSHDLNQRPHYYSRIAVAPDNPDEVYFAAVRLWRSLDGGLTYDRVPWVGVGYDYHDIWIDPGNGNRIINASDHHVNISVNRGETWHGVALPIAQMYHVAVDDQIPYNVYGSRQDGPAVRGPSRSLNSTWSGGEILPSMWRSVGGFEAGIVAPDTVEPEIIWAGAKGGGLDRYDLKTGHARPVTVWPDMFEGRPAAELRYRFQWTFPIAISPHDHNRVYVGSQCVHMTTDGGQKWTVISPDLSTNDKSKQQVSGGLTPDNDSPEYACVIFAIAESPLEKGQIWAGTNDGLLHLTRDGGARWTNVTANIPRLPPWGTVSCIEPSRYDAGTCYVSLDPHQVNDRNPYVYKTSDFGKTWVSIGTNIPVSVFSYVHCVREDPVRKGLLYLGTENGLYLSFDDGARWLPLQANLPRAPVYWIAIQERFHDLVVGTYGRGFWILDDITPIQRITPEIQDSMAYLFPPRPAYSFLGRETILDPPDHGYGGQNPPAGASLNYFLKNAPAEPVRISILDDRGNVVKSLEGTGRSGLNRVWWDLCAEPSLEPRLRTSPLYAPWVKPGKNGYRDYAGWGGPVTLRVAPGIYTVRLESAQKTQTQPIEIIKDPGSAGTVEDIRVQVGFLLELRRESQSVAGMVNTIEDIRDQIEELRTTLRDKKNIKPILTASDRLDASLIAVEGDLIQLKLTGAGQDGLRWPARLYDRIGSLAAEVGRSDFIPTDPQMELARIYSKERAASASLLERVLAAEIPPLAALLKKHGFPGLVVKRRP
jgi:photosystem II stability/assembly factor-like uncharacterized protein